MSVDSVRQVDILDPSERIVDTTDIMQVEETVGGVEEVLVENYPFPDQEVIRGEYHYEKSRWGTSEATGTYQIRQGSGLIAVHRETGPVDLDKICDALDEVLDGRASIHKDLLPSRQGLWQFIDNAESRVELQLLMPYGETKSLSQIREEDNMGYDDLYGDYPIEEAIVVFELPSGGHAEVTYKGNTLSVSSNDSDAYEFVLQRFERDAVKGV